METTTASLLKSIADETRLSIIRQLARERSAIPCSQITGDCARALQLSQPTMSHHFKKLVQSGALLEQKHGTEKHYQLNLKLLKQHGIDARKL